MKKWAFLIVTFSLTCSVLWAGEMIPPIKWAGPVGKIEGQAKGGNSFHFNNGLGLGGGFRGAFPGRTVNAQSAHAIKGCPSCWVSPGPLGPPKPTWGKGGGGCGGN